MIARLPRTLTFLVIAGATLSVAVAAMPVVTRMSDRDRAWVAATAPPETRVQASRTDLSPIFDFAPFGRADPPAPPPPVADTPVAAPDFTLQGVSVGDTDAASRAIISSGGATASYGIGDAVAPGVTLSEIAADHVTLDAGNQSQTLYFPQASLAVPAVTAVTAPKIVMPDLENLIPQSATAPSAPLDPIANARAAFQRNPKAVLQHYGIEATAQGYVITDATAPDLLAIGLAPGDVITAINGQKVGDILADQAYLLEASTKPRVKIDLLRGGQGQSLSVPLP